MTIAACAALVAKGDPDRFLATMAAPPQLRAHLFPLYAFNLEVARAPWASQEPLIAEMRLQWWRDVIAAPDRKAHEVAGPLYDTIRATGLPVDVLDRMVAARRLDVAGMGIDGASALAGYLQDTAGGLMWLAARACGAGPGGEDVAHGVGFAGGLAAYLRAVPALVARGREPLPGMTQDGIATLAADGLRLLDGARGLHGSLGDGRVALLAGWMARPVLRRAARDPAAVAEGRLAPSEFRRRAGLVWASMTGQL
ncbi:MAG: phytoene/squalene synthase family protein [Gemmobacter sp.]